MKRRERGGRKRRGGERVGGRGGGVRRVGGGIQGNEKTRMDSNKRTGPNDTIYVPVLSLQILRVKGYRTFGFKEGKQLSKGERKLKM